MAKAIFNIKDIMANTTVEFKVKGFKEYKFRLKLFLFLLNIISKILPMKATIEYDIVKK